MSEFEASFRRRAPYEEVYDCVSMDNPEYQHNRKKTAEAARRGQQFFGHEVISELFQVDKDKRNRELQSTIATHAFDFAGLVHISDFFADGFDTLAVQKNPYIRNLTQGRYDIRAVQNCIAAAVDGKIPTDAMQSFIQARQQQFTLDTQAFHQEIPRLRRDFIKRLRTLSDHPRHAFNLTMIGEKAIEKRLDEVAIVVADPLELLQRHETHAIGEYNHDKNYGAVVYARASRRNGSKDEHRNTAWHEFGHVISGRTIQKQGARFFAQRIGTRAYDSVYKEWRYGWLDEAIIETLTMDLVDLQKRQWDQGEYLPARQLYRRLLQRIPEQLFLGNALETSVPGAELNYRPRLIQAIDRTYGPHFLLDIDDLVRKHGIREIANRFDDRGKFHKS